jgi:hypothetical protein
MFFAALLFSWMFVRVDHFNELVKIISSETEFRVLIQSVNVARVDVYDCENILYFFVN